MPNYDYKCPKCETVEEVFHSMAEVGKIIVKCKKCKNMMHKLFSSGTTGYVSIRTLGALADRNADRFSEDQKIAYDKKRLDPKANKLLIENQ